MMGVGATEIIGKQVSSVVLFFGLSTFATEVVVFGGKLLAFVDALSFLCFLKYVCASSRV
jgi:hypothetical protein